jgi:hypothetical protein
MIDEVGPKTMGVDGGFVQEGTRHRRARSKWRQAWSGAGSLGARGQLRVGGKIWPVGR